MRLEGCSLYPVTLGRKICGFGLELPGGGVVVEVTLLPWCGGATGAPPLDSTLRPRRCAMPAKKQRTPPASTPAAPKRPPAKRDTKPPTQPDALTDKKLSALDAA